MSIFFPIFVLLVNTQTKIKPIKPSKLIIGVVLLNIASVIGAMTIIAPTMLRMSLIITSNFIKHNPFLWLKHVIPTESSWFEFFHELPRCELCQLWIGIHLAQSFLFCSLCCHLASAILAVWLMTIWRFSHLVKTLDWQLPAASLANLCCCIHVNLCLWKWILKNLQLSKL